ncbi:MAG: radical SAM protein [Trichlorobacter sp.]|uniref:B12-binding domain-containing radical SAM protein n=1 Tax=Trichlorobacter sp. TaxID=2911007 RepID=UPI00256993B7|nr:radical SAM protein [Trichlorobacter sp.]MDK9717570.1 radical SAM protein [Trichlorobacter sp.]
MHTLLAYTTRAAYKSRPDEFESLLPIGLCSLHALLRSQQIPVTLANFSNMPNRQIIDLLLQIQPTVAGLSQWTHNRHVTLELARLIKQTLPNCTILLGGGHATHQAELILQRHCEVDLIAVGEAEQTLLDLLDALQTGTPLTEIPGVVIRTNNGILHTAQRQPWPDLDQLPFPTTWLHEAVNVNTTLQAEFISSSRGCPAACNFCASPAFWGRKIRYRSAASVAEEMLSIREQYGLIHLSLRDDTFTSDRRRTVALCQELITRRINLFWSCQSRVEAIDQETLEWMRRAGCECVQLGVESGSPDILKLLGKRILPDQIRTAASLIRQAGMQLSVYLITGIPEERDLDRQLTINLIKQIQPDDLQVAPLAYYPGTALFETAVKNGRLQPDLFETSHEEAVLAEQNGQRKVTQMLSRTVRYRQHASIKQLLSIQEKQCYSAVTAMQTGDAYAAEGELQRAEEQYQLITQKEPDHPWGWFLLGELYEQTNKHRKALECYQKVRCLVPLHKPANESLQRLGH